MFKGNKTYIYILKTVIIDCKISEKILKISASLRTKMEKIYFSKQKVFRKTFLNIPVFCVSQK